MILSTLRKIRHGPLRRFGWFWVGCGNLFRFAMRKSNRCVTQMIGDYGPFKLDIKFAFSNFSAWGADRHNDGFEACVQMCNDKLCVLDVGAHIGLVTLPVASVLAPGGKVFSFEPSRANRNLLKKHVALNGFSEIVHIEDKLVGPHNETDIPFYEMDDASGMNSQVESSKADEYKKTTKDQICLDAFCEQRDLLPDIIKIDVEGAEVGVLRGAEKLIQKAKPVIFLSVHPHQISMMGHSLAELTEIFDRMEYSCTHVDGTTVENFALREYVLKPITPHHDNL